MKIMIDMDDVIVSGGFLYLINNFLGSNYEEKDFKEYYMQDIIPNKDEFFDWFLTKNVYEHSVLSPNVVEVIEALNQKYEVFIGTSYLYREIPDKCGYILGQKFNFLRENFPFLNPSHYIFLTDKSILNVDIKIDDRIDNLENSSRKILFTAYHNENFSDEELSNKGIERALDWKDIARKLL